MRNGVDDTVPIIGAGGGAHPVKEHGGDGHTNHTVREDIQH